MDKKPSKKEFYEALEMRHGEKLQEKLSGAAVAVCGLGGLGSSIAVALARAGIGRLILIDFDRVDITNLHRQQYFVSQIGMYKTDALLDTLRKIAPYGEIEIHTKRVTEDNLVSLLGTADIICEAFDRAEEKAMLCRGVRALLPHTYLVAASGMAGIGPGNAVQTRKIGQYFYVCGDGVSDTEKDGSLYSARVMLCAAHQAHAVLRILAGKFEV